MQRKILKELCQLAGASGFESDVRDYLIKAWEKHLDDYIVDGMENLIGVVKSKMSPSPQLNVLIMAHMDEVGLIVKDITEEGFLHFDTLGGQTDEAIAGHLWKVHTEKGDVSGYSGLESGHTMASFPPSQKINQKQFFLDVGATSRIDAEEMGIRIGSAITYGGPSFKMQQTRILAKALDDRFALAIMTDLLEKIADEKEKLPFNLFLAATTQEELGMRGSKVVYQSLPAQPDFVINLDIGLARDYPLLYSQISGAPPTSKLPKLGGGLTITAYDHSMITNPKLINYLSHLCRDHKVDYQLDCATMSATDASCLQQSGPGLPVVNIGIPIRYAHSHLSMMDTRDYDSLLNFMMHFCQRYDVAAHQQLFPTKKKLKNNLFSPIEKEDKKNASCDMKRSLT